MLAEIDVQIALEATVYLHVGDEKELVIGSAAEPDAQRLAHGAASAVATAYIGRFCLHRLTVAQNCGAHSVSILHEARQPGSPFDGAARLVQLGNEKALMIILWVGERK